MSAHLPADQALAVLQWLAWLWLAGFLVLPLVRRLLPDQADGAYVAAKLAGWTVVGFIPWFVSSLLPVSFSRYGPALAILALAVCYLACRERRWPRLHLPSVGLEVLFLLLFWLGLAQRLSIADLDGLEKFMDLGFMAATMQAEMMPPADPWFAGAPMNYYYFGHALAGQWALLADVPADHGFQLTMASLFALTGIGVFHLIGDMARPLGRRMAVVLGLFGTLLVLYAGNLHSFLYDQLRGWMPTTKPAYHMPDSTRFIGFDPPTDDKGFTEFPAYAFAVGDMHAHVLATPFFVLGLIALLGLLRGVWSGAPPRLALAALLGWVLGLCYLTNSWDLAILGMIALILLGTAIVAGRVPRRHLDGCAAAVITASAAAAITAAPFLASFEPFHQGLRLAPTQTPAWQLLVVHGYALPAIIALFVWLVRTRGRQPVQIIFAAGLALAALMLIAIPEIVYLKDIYGPDHARANTMFKLGFRAQTLMQMAAVAAIGVLARGARPALVAALVVAAPLVATLSYAQHTFVPPGKLRALDGLDFLKAEKPMVMAVRELAFEPGEALLEATGASFTRAARVSAMTGRPTVLGWLGHEWLWRDDPDAPAARLSLVDDFYTGSDRAARCRMIARFAIRYVVIGAEERARYAELDADGILALGQVVFETDAGSIVEIDRARCTP